MEQKNENDRLCPKCESELQVISPVIEGTGPFQQVYNQELWFCPNCDRKSTITEEEIDAYIERSNEYNKEIKEKLKKVFRLPNRFLVLDKKQYRTQRNE